MRLSRIPLFLPALLWMAISASAYEPFALTPQAPGRRGQRVEAYLLGGYWDSADITFGDIQVPDGEGGFSTSDIQLEMDSTVVFGFGVGWIINEHFSLNAEFEFGEADYRATWQNASLSSEMWMSSGKFNVDYNVLASRFTPFVTAGVGYFYFDTGIPSGPPEYYCWWDYWWGYVCSGYYPTYDEIDFMCDVGGGLRWDVTDQFFVKALGLVKWVDLGHGSDWPHFVQANLVVGMKF